MSQPIQNPWGSLEPPRSSRWPTVLLVLVVLVIGALLVFKAWSSATAPTVAELAKVTAVESRLTHERDEAIHLVEVNRNDRPEVWFRVTLKDVPRGKQLHLHCDWTAPDGQVMHQNDYETRAIDKDPWPTHARCRFGPTSATGQWQATLKLSGRVLATAVLDVRDADQPKPRQNAEQEIGDKPGDAK